MRVRITDPALLDDLLEFLRRRPDAILARIDATHVEVSLLGSMNRAHRASELEQRLEPWRAQNDACGVAVDPPVTLH